MIPATRKCLWCDIEFTASDPYQAYCKKTHKNMASSARKRAAKCPRSDKRSHATRDAAAIESAATEIAVQPYLCRCGSWHIGHNPALGTSAPKRIVPPRPTP